MKQIKKRHTIKTLAASAAACVLVFGSSTAAYAADVGGIQRTVQLWLHGDQTTAVIRFDGNGNYDASYTDGDGNPQSMAGGGVSVGPDGTVTPATEEELLEQLNAPEVSYADDGAVSVSWYGQTVDITDKFVDGVCYVELANGDETLYMTVKYQNGFATSPKKYPSPASFN